VAEFESNCSWVRRVNRKRPDMTRRQCLPPTQGTQRPQHRQRSRWTRATAARRIAWPAAVVYRCGGAAKLAV